MAALLMGRVRLWPAAVWGALVGALAALVWQLPAAWLADGLGTMTQGRLQMLEPRGTVWRGQARIAVTGGPDSIDRVMLPGVLGWRLAPTLGAGMPGLRVDLHHPDLVPQPVPIVGHVGLSGWGVQMQMPAAEGRASLDLPASWLGGLGAPWNTLDLGGRMVIQFRELGGRWPWAGPPELRIGLRIRMQSLSSRVVALPVLGSYELEIGGTEAITLTLSSLPSSALQLQGRGQWKPGGRLEFQGQASAAAGRQEALSNLLNIIGRRDGNRSVISL